MSFIQVFDPAMGGCGGGCGGSGGCGGGGNAEQADFAADVQWATQMGARIERANLIEQPMAFAGNAVVKGYLERSGLEALPLVLVDGEVAMAGRYPNRVELARWAGIKPMEMEEAGNCCSGGRCCG